MSSNPTPIYLSDRLVYTLAQNNIAPEEYLPAYGGESACLDLYYVGYPTFSVPPGQLGHQILIPTGLHIALPKDRVALIQERGSISKTTLKVRAGVIDAGYTGEILCNCINVSTDSWIFRPHEKLPFQLLILPVFNQFEVLNQQDWDLHILNTKRGEGKLGSSDKSSS